MLFRSCGGVDNIFPHHTNEIAQSEAYLGHPWCKYWVHGEHLNDASGKMSKSKGKVLTESLLESEGFNPLSYRFMVLLSHYRKQLTFSFDSLAGAENAYNKLKNKINALKNEGDIDNNIKETYVTKFKECLESDLNTANALTILYDTLKENTTDSTKIEIIKEMDKVLSLDLLKKEEVNIDEEYIKDMIQKRNIAKEQKDYNTADKIREELERNGIILKDTREGTVYEVK